MMPFPKHVITFYRLLLVMGYIHPRNEKQGPPGSRGWSWDWSMDKQGTHADYLAVAEFGAKVMYIYIYIDGGSSCTLDY